MNDDDDDVISEVMRHVDDAFILHSVNYKDLAALYIRYCIRILHCKKFLTS